MIGSGAARLLAAVVVCQLAAPVMAEAQARPTALRPSRPAPHAGSIEISGGLAWGGGFDLGSADATLTRNPGTGAGGFDLFVADSRLDSGLGPLARLAVFLSPTVSVEAGFRLLRPTLSVDLGADAEEAAETTATETINQYTIDGSLVWHLTGAAFAGGRAVPFLAGGAGYLRDLHDGNELMETGIEYHAAAGVKYWLSERPRRAGIRGEVGVSVRDGGFDFRDGTRTVPVASVSLVFLF